MFSSSVKLLYSDAPGVALAEKQPYFTYFTPGIINEKQINNRIIKLKCVYAPRSWSNLKNTVVLTKKLVKFIEYSCFDHSDFLSHSMFKSDVC